MEIRRGLGVSPGIAIAQAYVLERERGRVSRRLIEKEQVEEELRDFENALSAALEELEQLRRQTASAIGNKYAAILNFHYAVLADPSFSQEVRQRISLNKFSAAYAVSRILQRYARSISEASDELFRSRISDIYDIEHRLLRHLTKTESRQLRPESEVIIIAHDLTPSQTASLDKAYVKGFVTDLGGKTSHTAIVARAIGIPAVVGLSTITAEVSNGDLVIVDGSTGTVIIDPDDRTLQRYRAMQQTFEEFERQLTYLKTLPAETVDGYRVKLYANVEFQEELQAALEMGADGIGLYRTEFLFLGRSTYPTEEEQFRAYRVAARVMDGRPVIIRTLDLGADKMPEDGSHQEANPFLGCRSIRYTLICRPDLFKSQILAILRASAFGDVRMMLPMVTSVDEVRRAKILIHDAMDELKQRGEPFNPDIKVGVMIEVPSAAMAADLFTKEVDFFSIGTNDLIQYTLAVDRANPTVASLYQPTHPSVLRLLKNVIETGRRYGIPVAVCGEMSGDVLYVPLLLGLGLELFSAAPPNILEVKKVIRSLTLREAEELAKKVLATNDAIAAENILRERTHRIVPQLV